MDAQLVRISEFLESLENDSLGEDQLDFLVVGGSGGYTVANNSNCTNSNQASCPKATDNNCTCSNG
jgi:hypothetical protein